MNPGGPDPSGWSRGRWWGAVCFATLVQAGFIFTLSDRNPLVPRQADASTTIHLVGQAAPGSALDEWLRLEDPTLFALPDPRGFSGAAWLRSTPPEHQSQDWTEPPRWLALPVAGLGATFAEFVRGHSLGPTVLTDKPPPTLSEVPLSLLPLPARSTIRLEGGLAGRELVTPVDVPALPHSDILADTVVQVVVEARGFVFSPPVVVGSSGSKAADDRALALVKSMRFKPVAPAPSDPPGNSQALTWGKVIFQWRTLEPTAPNPPAAGPPP